MTNPQSPFAVASCTLQTSLRGEGPGTPHLPARAASRVCPSPAPGRSRLAPRLGLIPVLDPAPFEGSKLFQHSRNVPFCFSSLLHPLYFPSCATGSAFPGQAPGAFLAQEETRDRLDAPRCSPQTPLPQPCHPRGTCSGTLLPAQRDRGMRWQGWVEGSRPPPAPGPAVPCSWGSGTCCWGQGQESIALGPDLRRGAAVPRAAPDPPHTETGIRAAAPRSSASPSSSSRAGPVPMGPRSPGPGGRRLCRARRRFPGNGSMATAPW